MIYKVHALLVALVLQISFAKFIPDDSPLNRLIDSSRKKANSTLYSILHKRRMQQLIRRELVNNEKALVKDDRVFSPKDEYITQPLWNEKVLFYTVETRGEKLHRLNGPPGWDWGVRNPGAGKTWEGLGTKIETMRVLLPTLPDDQLLAFVDGGDVMYGGCDLDDLVERFTALSTRTGTPVIFGAESNCYVPPTAGCGDAYPVHKWNEALLAGNVTEEGLEAWASAEHPKIKFLNSGFYMGRVKDIRALYEFVVNTTGNFHDQRAFAQTLQDHPDMVTLDYASMLVSNLFGVPLDKNGTQRFSFDEGKQQWLNHATGKPVCFFHGNGPAKRMLPVIADGFHAF